MKKPRSLGTFDAVIIGGGAVGTSAAYAISKTGLSAALVDRAGIGSGTSGRCDGNVLISDKAPGYDMALNKASLNLFPVIARELDYDIAWRQKGSLIIAENEPELEMCSRLCAGIAAAGYPVRMLSREETLASEPCVSVDVAGSMETDCDGSLNPMALCQGQAHGFSQQGGKLFLKTEVRAIKLDPAGAVEAVDTDQGRLLTKAVVACAGVWTRHLGRMVNLTVPIEPRQGQILVAEKSRYVAPAQGHGIRLYGSQIRGWVLSAQSHGRNGRIRGGHGV